MTMNSNRIFVEKKQSFRVEADSLLADFNENLSLNLKSLRLIVLILGNCLVSYNARAETLLYT